MLIKFIHILICIELGDIKGVVIRYIVKCIELDGAKELYNIVNSKVDQGKRTSGEAGRAHT